MVRAQREAGWDRVSAADCAGAAHATGITETAGGELADGRSTLSGAVAECASGGGVGGRVYVVIRDKRARRDGKT